MPELPKAYEPAESERRWYEIWERRGYFRPEVNPRGEPFSIVIPPPNITGSLHMGHALNATLQDILVRWKRMQGRKALWLPGTDHAGIATQNVVERQLAQEGLSRHDLGREEFLKRVWQWREQYGERIIYQLKKLGASCDWQRQRFTLDEGLSKAVRTVFVRLYEEGLIYRSTRLINWCPRCHTALSDLEVEHEEVEGTLTYIRYPLLEAEGHVVVATTRPETMLGDAAVAVNPRDERYRHLVGRRLELPLTGRQIPVVADPEVDPAFGTGAVKVTPAHDFADEAIARRQSPPLEFLTVIGPDGRMTKAAGARYQGLDRYECRRQVVEDLKARGLLQRQEPYRHAVGHCYRCKTVIEPLLTPQWYVRTGPLAREAIRAVREGRIRLIPKGWENSYFAWMENIKDWCISRQIWWGHRIPVWYCQSCAHVNVALEAPQACQACGSRSLRQDEDVLDTWFSSALWPFSTLGWPEQTQDLRTFYPTDVLVTAFDILFFWVARMAMMGLKFMGEVPFRDVYIHALVRDEEGQKMSKSKGNVVDPLVMVQRHGADAFRFSLAAFAAQGRDIRFSEARVKGYRHFMNKLYNATKFILTNTEGQEAVPPARDLPSRWILSRLARCAQQVQEELQAYRFNEAAGALYQFIWHELCDWYIETAKLTLQEPQVAKGVRWTLLRCLNCTLRLLHPFAPFITEELWQHLPQGFKEAESVMIAPWPGDLRPEPQAEALMQNLIDAISGIRTIRGELRIQPGRMVNAFIKPLSEEAARVLREHVPMIRRLARLQELKIDSTLQKPHRAAVAVKPTVEVYVPVDGLVDVSAELRRLQKELKKVLQEMAQCQKKLLNEDFLAKAPPEVVKKEKQKYEELSHKRDSLEDSVNRFKSLEVKDA
jgi:valyl-tRNA synthetase